VLAGLWGKRKGGRLLREVSVLEFLVGDLDRRLVCINLIEIVWQEVFGLARFSLSSDRDDASRCANTKWPFERCEV
jgi:hypothetical protein